MTRPALAPRRRHPALRAVGHAVALLVVAGLWCLLALVALHAVAWVITR